MSEDPNRLLFVISAHGSMTWAQYCEAFDFLSTERSEKERVADRTATRSGLLQCMEALGHCNMNYEQGKSTISIAPAALCRLPKAGLPTAVLTGARCVHTQDELIETARARGAAIRIVSERHVMPPGLIPDTILVQSDSEVIMKSFCADLQIDYVDIPPAWSLVNWCGRISEYEASLDFRIPDTLEWQRSDFSLDFQCFIRTHSDSFPRYCRYRNPTTGLPMHVFFKDSYGAEVDLNWGRYLLFNAKGVSVTAYDENRYRLCVPVRSPLPSVVARTLCLCSGKPPVHRSKDPLVQNLNCQDWLMYEDVPPQIAMAALSKVGQSPVRVKIR